MGSQLFKVLSTSVITMNMIIKFKMSHVKQNYKCAQMKESAGVTTKPCNEETEQMTTFQNPISFWPDAI